MEPLHYDPRTKQQIKDVLYDFLYTPAVNQFQKRLATIVVKNCLLNGFTHKSFHYKGEFYTCDSGPPPRKWNLLSANFRPEMDEYLADLKEMQEKEKPYVMGYIIKVLNSSADFQNYMQLFPEALHYPLQKLLATCPCKTKTLAPEDLQKILDTNKESISMLKARLMTNLLI